MLPRPRPRALAQGSARARRPAHDGPLPLGRRARPWATARVWPCADARPREKCGPAGLFQIESTVHLFSISEVFFQ
jgi:hypothetical protein